MVSNDVVKEIEYYQTIVNNAGISSSDNTNVHEYINKVAQVIEYEKYNDYWSYSDATADDLKYANFYFNQACDSLLDSIKSSCLSISLNHFNSCLNMSYNYDYSSFGISESQDFLQLYIDKINYYFETGRDMELNYEVIYAYESMVNEYKSVVDEVISLKNSLPTYVY